MVLPYPYETFPGLARQAWRMLRRDWRAAELYLLSVALVLAVAALSSVGFLADRMRLGLAQDAHQMLGADLVVRGDAPLAPDFAQHAAQLGLRTARTAVFPSMVMAAPSDGGAITVGPQDTLLTAYNRMRQADVSQLPVLDGGRLIGLIDESDLLEAVEDSKPDKRFSQQVAAAMTAKLDTLQAGDPLDALLPVFEKDQVAIVLDGREFVGLITRIDLINYLRRAA